MIKGITFDLWDTVFIDDSDEPKRKAAGRPSKSVERRQLVHKFINKYSPASFELVNSVYDAVDAAFKKVWLDQHVTWNVQERLKLVLKGLGKQLPESEINELIRLHEEMELDFRPDFVTGVHETLAELSKNFKLAVISDTIFSPGRTLRKLLEDESLLGFFDVFVFSDEQGFSKPDVRVFNAASDGLGIELNELVHIGDREHNDIIGPKKLGMGAVLCTAAIDRGSNNTQADAIFKDYKDLPKIIETINK
ncbi:HAD family hydrolase [candidate division KSB1 bacterium]|nr:HAD family hydrolase [candidate division KSB1 bacterium]MBL7093456.1 HAD family hydrolase [candidate division KSB1 bacterium]